MKFNIQIIFSLLTYVACLENFKRTNPSMLVFNAPISPVTVPVVSAILLKCSNDAENMKSNSTMKHEHPTCEEQLLIHIRVNPSFRVECADKFLVLDEVYDQHSRCKVKIMSPYLIEISRGEPVMMYPLEFTKAVKCKLPTKSNTAPIKQINDHKSSGSKERIKDKHKNVHSGRAKNQHLANNQNHKRKMKKIEDKMDPLIKKHILLTEISSEKQIAKRPERDKNLAQIASIGDQNEKSNNKYPNDIAAQEWLSANLEQNPKNENRNIKSNKLELDFDNDDEYGDELDGMDKAQHPISKKSKSHRIKNRRKPKIKGKVKGVKNKSQDDFRSESHKGELKHIQDRGDLKENSKKLNNGKSVRSTFIEDERKPYHHIYYNKKDRSNHARKFGADSDIEIEEKEKMSIKENRVPSLHHNMKLFRDVEDKQKIESRGVKPKMMAASQIHIEPQGTIHQTPNKWSHNNLEDHPFVSVIDEPNLNTNEKLDIIQVVVDPQIESRDRELNKLSQEVDNSFIVYPKPMPMPITLNTINPLIAPVNNKRKRSFLFYDDLTTRNDIDEDNDYNMDRAIPNFPRISLPGQFEDDVQPCASCGGKGKKPQGKTENSIYSSMDYCKCKRQHATCNCISSKQPRSITNTWYTVFNMSSPLPFLITKVRIFRKRHNIWWKIAPSITLNSLSGIFANENLSILFSSHVDIFQLEKSMHIQNHQLLIPKNDSPFTVNDNEVRSVRQPGSFRTEDRDVNGEYINPDEIFTIFTKNTETDPSKLQSTIPESITEDDTNTDNNLICTKIQKVFKRDSNVSTNNDLNRHLKDNEVHAIGDLGYFPISMNVIEHCPNDKNRLCLNMLDDKVPAYTIKLKIPFRENAAIQQNMLQIKIARIITDATTNDALQISVDIINKGYEVGEVFVCVHNCPLSYAASKTTVRRYLMPFIMDTVTFLIPCFSESSQKRKIFNCDVLVKLKTSTRTVRTPRNRTSMIKTRVIAKRQLTVELGNRCLCVWHCKCHCTPRLETHVDFNACQKLMLNDLKDSGFLLNPQQGRFTDDNMDNSKQENMDVNETRAFCNFLYNAVALLAIMLLLGLIKAILGICFKRIGSCGYKHIQPGRKYDDSSFCRRFLVNIIFFVVFPYVFLCKCFKPSEDDLKVASAEWQCSMHTHKNTNDDDDDEEVILSQHIERQSNFSDTENRLIGGQEVIFNFNENISDADFDNIDDDNDDEESNTKFVLQALEESRESLKKLLQNNCNNHSQDCAYNLDKLNDSTIEDANNCVETLKEAKIVYRIFEGPIGDVKNIPPHQKYCIQGYFLPSLGAEYEFVNYDPLIQYCCIDEHNMSVINLRPPAMLRPKDFSRTYINKFEVLEAGDLIVKPPNDIPCINVSTIRYSTELVRPVSSLLVQYNYSRFDPADLPYPQPSSFFGGEDVISLSQDQTKDPITDESSEDPNYIQYFNDTIHE